MSNHPRIRVDVQAPCPCGSARAAGDCCAPTGDLTPWPAEMRSGRPCGAAVRRCYARVLGDCGGGLSGEHTVSESVLREVGGQDAKKVFARGPRWRGGRWFATAELQSNVLCVRHNEMLSPLDARMGRFAKALRAFTDAGAPGPSTFAIHGHDVERWLLKTLCGLVASGQAVRYSGVPFARDLNQRWLRILYGRESMPPTWGLYVALALGDTVQSPESVSVAPVFVSSKLVGINVNLFGWSLTLALTHVNRRLSRGLIGQRSLHRLALLQTEPSGSQKRIYLHWEDGDHDPPLLDYRAPRTIVQVG